MFSPAKLTENLTEGLITGLICVGINNAFGTGWAMLLVGFLVGLLRMQTSRLSRVEDDNF